MAAHRAATADLDGSAPDGRAVAIDVEDTAFRKNRRSSSSRKIASRWLPRAIT